jgi:hypothetical protein
MWTAHFLDHATANSDMCAALNTIIVSGAGPYSDSSTLLTGAVSTLLDAGARDGSLRTDVATSDVLLLIGGVSSSTTAKRADLSHLSTRSLNERCQHLLAAVLERRQLGTILCIN